MFLFTDFQPETFVDENTGAQLKISSFSGEGKPKMITIEITDKDGHQSRVNLNSKKDIRRFLDYFETSPVRPLGAFATSSSSFSTAPTYIKTGIGVYLLNKDSNRSQFISLHRVESVLDHDYQSLCELLDVCPDAIVLFYWFDGSIRRSTIESVITFCVDYQKEFILTGDPMKCRRMTLKTVAQQTKVNLSSVSRCADKNVRIYTPFTTFNLDNHKCSLEEPSLFDEGIIDRMENGEPVYVTRNGQEVSRLQVLKTLRDLIDNEDKTNPYRDERLSKLMTDMGYPIQRRTVVKYREEYLGEPSSSRRKKINPTEP